MVIVYAEEIIEVASHILCRFYRSMDIYLGSYIGERRELVRQDSRLYLGSKT